MIDVLLWIPRLGFDAKVLFYKVDHEEDFHRDVRPHISSDVLIYKILPNGYPFIDLLKVYLYLKIDPTHSWLLSDTHGLDPKYVWIARNFVRLKDSLKTWDERGALSAVTFLLKERALLHPEQVRLLELCKNIVERVIRPVLWGSPLTLASPSPTAKAWWGLSCSLTAEVGLQIQDIKTFFSGQLPAAQRNGLHIWLSELKNWLDTKLFVSSQGDALREASAMCHGLSKIHYSLGRYTLAVVLCHRAADLLLFAECAAANLVNFTANNGGGEFRQSFANGDKKITLTNCHDALVGSGQYIYNSSRWATFDSLNKYRNLLILTHYMGSLSAQNAKTILEDTAKELKSIGGAGWDASSRSIFQLLELEAHEFFSLSESLMGVLVPS